MEHLISADEAEAGDMVDPASIPTAIRAEGGGWIGRKYFCSGSHRDGTRGWKCIEVRR